MTIAKGIKTVGRSITYAGLGGLSLSATPGALLIDLVSTSCAFGSSLLLNKPYPTSYFQSTASLWDMFSDEQKPLYYKIDSKDAKFRHDLRQTLGIFPELYVSFNLLLLLNAPSLFAVSLLIVTLSMPLIGLGCVIHNLGDSFDKSSGNATRCTFFAHHRTPAAVETIIETTNEPLTSAWI